jgi:hypothetical protein
MEMVVKPTEGRETMSTTEVELPEGWRIVSAAWCRR